MGKILITGASGFIGKALAETISKTRTHELVCMSRSPTDLAGVTYITGDFSVPQELSKLDPHADIDVLIHLAAVTGRLPRGGLPARQCGRHASSAPLSHRPGMQEVRPRQFYRRGCMQSDRFRPLQLPMPDEHPCLDRDGYGFSKYMMEEVTPLPFPAERRVGILSICGLPASPRTGPATDTATARSNAGMGDGRDFNHVSERYDPMPVAGRASSAEGGGTHPQRRGRPSLRGRSRAGADEGPGMAATSTN